MAKRAHEHFCRRCVDLTTKHRGGWWRCVDLKCVRPLDTLCRKHVEAKVKRDAR